ncbi:MAG: UDP-glucose/GDP-mannose dehydrogenase family protein [Acidimicrobiia bacterium]
MSEIAVIGAGYVGIPTAVCFAHLGHRVVCADVDEDRVRLLTKGEAPILEEGLTALLAEGLESGRLRFVVGAADAARDAEFVFLCVPTPQHESGAADLSFVEQAAREIAPVLRPRAVVVNKSTMPVGSTDVVARVLRAAGAPAEVTVASNPEFLRQGHAIADTLAPHRVVVGCDDTEVAVRVSELYRDVKAPILVTDPASAEVVKYASNAFLATKISFVNSIANLCEVVNADMREVVLGMGYDPRIGFETLHPGPGYGGSCFPKDVAALLDMATSYGYEFDLLRSVVAVNERQRDRVVEKVRAACGGSVAGRSIGIWGLTFKANTDDLRESPAVYVVEALVAEGAELRVYDPVAAADATDHLAGVERVADPYEAATGTSVVALLTEWEELKALDFREVRASMQTPLAIVDARNLLDASALRLLGFAYQGIGR